MGFIGYFKDYFRDSVKSTTPWILRMSVRPSILFLNSVIRATPISSKQTCLYIPSIIEVWQIVFPIYLPQLTDFYIQYCLKTVHRWVFCFFYFYFFHFFLELYHFYCAHSSFCTGNEAKNTITYIKTARKLVNPSKVFLV